MSKALLTRFLARAVRQGRLGVVYADGSADTHPAGSPFQAAMEAVMQSSGR